MLVLVASAAGQPEPARSAHAALAGQIELARLVDLAAQRLHLDVDYDAAALKGTVTLRLDDGVSDADLWSLTNRLLASRGFTTVRMPGANAVTVTRIADAANLSAIRTSAEAAHDQQAPLPAGFVSVVLRLHHRPAKEIVEAVSRMLSKPGGSITELSESSGLLLLSDLAPRVEQALALIGQLDVPFGGAAIEEVTAQHMPGAALATLVTQVAAKREAVSGEKVPGEVLSGGAGNAVLVVASPEHAAYWKALIAQLDQREEVSTTVYTPRNFGAAEVAALIEQAVHTAPGDTAVPDRWRLVVDQLTGTLIITATPSEHAHVAALFARLNAAPLASRRPVRSFTVRNRSVTELLPILNDLMQVGMLEATATPATADDITAARVPQELRPAPPPVLPNAGDGAGAEGVQPQPEPVTPATAAVDAPPALVLSADEATNTLIAMGEPRLLEQLQALIRQLDVRQPQVMLEVMLVSLTESQTASLGIELEKIDLDPDLSYRLSSLFGLSGRSGGVPVAGGAGLTGVVLNPGDFSVVLRALQTIQDGRSLSMPRMLVGNNQSASLDSVLEQPFTSTNASNTVSTTSFAGSLPAGTQVSITPQIAEGDHLTLKYQVSLSSFTGAPSGPGVPPPRQQNRVQSVATIPDGFTVVVGGIELETEGKSVSQVPLLGDIPILGEAFKNRNRNTSRQRFYVFIRASVLRAGGFEDLKYLSGVAAGGAGVDDGFPELAPRIIR